MTVEQTESRVNRLWPGLLRHATGELSVYGTILVAGLIVVEGAYIPALDDLMIAVVKGIAVIWAAHVFAATVAHTSRLTERESVGTALRHALIASTGLILASAGPLAILQLGVAGALSTLNAIGAALLWSAVALGALGFVALTRAGLPVWRRVTGAALTSAVGIVLVILKVLAN